MRRRIKIIGIYKITSPSGKVYIGQSIDIEMRFRYYKRIACSGQPILTKSLKKYGVENHTFEIVHKCQPSELNEFERNYQDLYCAMGPNGLNCRLTTSTDKGPVISEETRKKLSESMKGKIPYNKGKRGLYFHSEESKRKLSENSARPNLGRIWTKDQKKSMGRPGRIHTEETKIKIGNSVRGKMKGVPKSEEHKAKLRGVPRPKEVVQQWLATKAIKMALGLYPKRSAHNSIGILNTETGIFYDSIQEAADSSHIGFHSLYKKIAGKHKNNTPFIKA